VKHEPLDRIHGVAAVYDQPSVIYDEGLPTANRKMFAKRAFRVAGGSWWLDHAHDRNHLLASRHDGSLRCWHTDMGLFFEADIEATPQGAGTRRMLLDGFWQCSVGFVPTATTWNYDEGLPVEITTSCDLEHICVTYSGAFPQTAAWLASMPLDRLPPHHRNVARQWDLSVQDRDRQTARARARTSALRRSTNYPRAAAMAACAARIGAMLDRWAREDARHGRAPLW
jgi:phage head maturation protease